MLYAVNQLFIAGEVQIGHKNFIITDILITGSTGTGDSYIAIALGYQACIEGYRIMYYNYIDIP